jgi:hypothetical protein
MFIDFTHYVAQLLWVTGKPCAAYVLLKLVM